ncbi:MAG: BlaR1 family beta-lactam sensor/signal transducer [Blautia sp.]|nr:BlaR1 family beta-lactam sensor/signal transducer [Blautia sp.]
MSNWIIHFLISNIFICIFTLVIIGTKKLLKKYLSATTQYHLWFLLFLLLAVPFFPVQIHGSQLFSWLHFFQTDSGLNSGTDTLSKLTSNTQNNLLNQVNDFSVSISSRFSGGLNTILFLIWIMGVMIMSVLTLHSLNYVRSIKRSALPLQNQQVKTIYYDCLKELKISHQVPVYSTAFLKSPVLIGIIHPRIYIPIHLISELNPDDMRFMLLHELQHYRHKDTLIGFLMVISNILYWFNPFVWYALKEIHCDRELACDSAVLQMISTDEYQAYGMTLINFAEKLSSFSSPVAVGMSGNFRQMKRRILNIAIFRKETLYQKMRALIIYLVISAVFIGCTPILSIGASTQDVYHFHDTDKNISLLDVSAIFGSYDGSFVLYDNHLDSWKIYNLEEANKRIPPDSTYKIYDALLGLESGIITPEHSSMAWNGEHFSYSAWENDQDLNSAMQNSVNWYFQTMDSQLGLNKIQEFLNEIEYGNQTTSSNLKLYWSDFSLKISPIEQVELLKKFNTNGFHLHSQNVLSVKNAIKIVGTSDGTFYGKTGTGCIDGQDINGWFIGYIETSDNIYYFATNIQSDSNATGKKALEITSAILKKLHIWN